jgi:tetratricopeptide (TPR) repeat protein
MLRLLSPRNTAVWLVCFLIACPLLRGAVDWQVQLGAALVASGALFLAASTGQSRVSTFCVVLLAVLGVMLFQLVPLPAGMLRHFSPATADILEASLTPIGLFPSARPLSLDPPGTALELAKAAICTATALAVVLLSSRRGTRLLFLSILSLTGLVASSTALVHALITGGTGVASKVPFVNPNNMAGFLTLTAWPSLGLALERRGKERVLWLVCFVLAGSGTFLSASRGGIASFFAAAGVFAVLAWLGRRHPTAPSLSRGQRVLTLSATAAVLSVAGFIGFERILDKFTSVPLSRLAAIDKIALWPLLTSIIVKFPSFGIGKGAFGTTFPFFKVDADPFTWTHAENEWLQALLDLGIPFGLLLIGGFAWTWFRAARSRGPSWPRIGLIAGTAALALHNLVDFSFEILGVAVPFVVATALLSSDRDGFRVRGWVLKALSLSSLAIALSGVLLHLAHSADRDGGHVISPQDPAGVISAAGAAAFWHPADYFPHAAAAAFFVRSGDCERGVPWLLRAMLLNPTAPDPHYQIASCFAQQGKKQLARREYRLAYLFGKQDSLAGALRYYRSLPDLLEVAPESAQGLVTLGGLLGDRGRFADACSVFEMAWNRYGDHAALERLAGLTLAAGEPARALEWTRLLRSVEPNAPTSYIVASEALLKLGKVDAARAELALGTERLPGNADLLIAYAALLSGQRHFAEARRALTHAFSPHSATMARVHERMSKTLSAEGRIEEAIAELQAASQLTPLDVNLRVELANLLAEARQFSEAISTLESASSLPGCPPGGFSERIAELTSKRDQSLRRVLEK